ncbi:xylulokinase [Nesterenkonia sandarakina]|uniref:Xylulokinase n=1 Tax=Nesterenkonia sandarakina TaxID=272918 RepID=A0A2T0YA91_9MICC|nr:FGGY family carbohydrate kinase [Nesterenkonia sandarakina]PRZ11613.1 xylulokinase [Nesterenkonia sandarakina]
MTPSRCFLGIDVGTTATKAVVLTETGEPVRRVRVAHDAGPPLPPGRVDPVSWWNSVQKACLDLDAGKLNLSGIGLSVHSPVAVPMGTSGEHLTAGYRYEVPTLADTVSGLRPLLTQEEIRRSGNTVSPSTFIAAAYLLMLEQEPEVAGELNVLGSVGTYIGHRLTGQCAIDPTQASYFGPFDTTGDWTWQEDLVQRLGIPPQILPPLLPSSDVLAPLTDEAAHALGLRPGTPVVTGAGDTACAAFAADIGESGTRLITLGTTHVVTDHSSRPAREQLHLQRAYVHRGQWLRHGASNGGLALSVAARALGYGSSGRAVSAMVDRAMGADAETIYRAPFFIPHVRPERAPFWMEEPRSGFLELTADADETSMAWAAVEGVLFVDRMISESYPQEPPRELMLAGDVSGNGHFMQLAADMFGTPFIVNTESHLPALGAAMLAAEGIDYPVGLQHYTRHIAPRQRLGELIESRWGKFCQVHGGYAPNAMKPFTT